MYLNTDRASKPTHFCQQSFYLNIFMARKNPRNILRSWSLAVIFQMGKWPQIASRDLAEEGHRDAGEKEHSLSRTKSYLLYCYVMMKAMRLKGKFQCNKPQKCALSAHTLDDFVASAFVGLAVPASASTLDIPSNFWQKLLLHVNLFCTYTLAKTQLSSVRSMIQALLQTGGSGGTMLLGLLAGGQKLLHRDKHYIEGWILDN